MVASPVSVAGARAAEFSRRAAGRPGERFNVLTRTERMAVKIDSELFRRQWARLAFIDQRRSYGVGASGGGRAFGANARGYVYVNESKANSLVYIC